MLLTLWLIRRNVVSFDYIPGFQKLSGLVLMIFATIAIMWIVDRTHIVVFSYLKFEYVLVIFAVLLVVMLWGWRKLFN
jgi:membrane protein implicated in regulation of membrane protease activity